VCSAPARSCALGPGMVGEGKNKRGNGSGGKRMLRVEFILAEGGGSTTWGRNHDRGVLFGPVWRCL
jgi:hypothetical protein